MTASDANEALLAAYTQHLATQPARTREAYLRDIGVLKALAGEAPLTALAPAMLRRFLAALHARGLSGRSLARMLSGWRAFYRFALERDSTLKDDPCAGLKAPKSARRRRGGPAGHDRGRRPARDPRSRAVRARILLGVAPVGALGARRRLGRSRDGRGARLGQGLQGANRAGRRRGP